MKQKEILGKRKKCEERRMKLIKLQMKENQTTQKSEVNDFYLRYQANRLITAHFTQIFSKKEQSIIHHITK